MKASISIEAAIVLPFILLVVVSCLSIIKLYDFHLGSHTVLSQMTARASVKASIDEEYDLSTIWMFFSWGISAKDKGHLFKSLSAPSYDLDYNYSVAKRAFENSFLSREFLLTNRVRSKKWNGDKDTSEASDEEYVYVTRTGSVYHSSINCTYLKPSTRATDFSNIENERNESGGKYQRCDICAKKNSFAGFVYITDYGTAYHRISNCKALRRDIKRIPISQASHLRGCGKCVK